MANDATDLSNNKIEVNGAGDLDLNTQSRLTLALLQNGGINRIQSTLQQRLDAAGWSQDLKEYTTRLLRSGTAATFPEIREIIMNNIASNGATTVDTPDGVPAPNLAIPSGAAEDAAEVVRRELAAIVKTKK